jgi:type IV pilus assembly protein PilP
MRVLALAALLALGACGADGPELKQELRELSKDLRGRVEPLPQVKTAEPAAYRSTGVPDPFYPAEGRR